MTRIFSLKNKIRKSVSRLLPSLRADDTSWLLPRHIAVINREVSAWHTLKWAAPSATAYALVLLKALEQVGDETSVPAVKGYGRPPKVPRCGKRQKHVCPSSKRERLWESTHCYERRVQITENFCVRRMELKARKQPCCYKVRLSEQL